MNYFGKPTIFATVSGFDNDVLEGEAIRDVSVDEIETYKICSSMPLKVGDVVELTLGTASWIALQIIERN